MSARFAKAQLEGQFVTLLQNKRAAVLGRIGDPIEVAGPVVALAASAGSYVTGQILYVDGGVTASQ